MDEQEIKKIDLLRDKINEVGAIKKSGRPRKFKLEYIDAQAVRLNEWLDKKSTEQLFWLKEYLLETGLTYSQIHAFADISFNYKKALERLKTMQEVCLCKYCATPKTNFVFGMFALKSICGWNDGTRVDSKSKATAYTDKIDE